MKSYFECIEQNLIEKIQRNVDYVRNSVAWEKTEYQLQWIKAKDRFTKFVGTGSNTNWFKPKNKFENNDIWEIASISLLRKSDLDSSELTVKKVFWTWERISEYTLRYNKILWNFNLISSVRESDSNLKNGKMFDWKFYKKLQPKNLAWNFWPKQLENDREINEFLDTFEKRKQEELEQTPKLWGLINVNLDDLDSQVW
jgi:hypothetical protein